MFFFSSAGVQVAQPTVVCLNDDRTETVASTLRTKLTANTQIVVLISQSLKGDLYATIKKICCAESPIPSQVSKHSIFGRDSQIIKIFFLNTGYQRTHIEQRN